MTPSRFGLSVAISTPFDRAGTLDMPRLLDHAKWCLAQGCDSITLFGTTGEGASVGLSTRAKVFEAMLKAGIKPKQLLTSVVASAIEDAADQAQQALDLGFLGLLLTPPFYFREIGEDALFQWFAQLFHRLGPKARDMFAYHLPSVTGVPLSVGLIGRLKREFPGVVVGVKDSSATWSNTAALLEQHSDLMILVGDERDLAKAVRMGGSGSICGLANFAPHILGGAARDGREDARIRPVVEAIVRYPVLPSVKAMIAHQKKDPAWRIMRPPQGDLDDARAAKMIAEVDAALRG
jgi:4-hydroxy-tetrahydrodipicolinate synthase